LYLSIILIFGVSASDVLVWQGQYYTGTTFNAGTYEFNFSVYDDLTGGDICYSNTTILTTGNWGEWRTEQYDVSTSCNNVSKDYFLNINIDGTNQNPRRRLIVWNYLRKDVNETTSGDIQINAKVITPIVNATKIVTNELNVSSNANILGTLRGHSPLKLGDEINFIKTDGTITSALYNAPRALGSALPISFADSLIHDIIEETNDYGMQECFWDENTETMQMCISGAYLSGRATTISRSLQIVGNTTNKIVNENFTLCEGNNYVDCETDITGADLLVEDDIESGGSIYSNENITANYFIGDGSLLTGIGKWNISGSYLYPSDLSKSIGIGKNDPHCRLDINGEIGLDGFEILDINNNYIAFGDLDGGGSDGIKFLVDAGEVTITNNADIITNGKIQGEYYSDDGSQGITNTLDYHVCTGWAGSNCSTWCTLRIKNGLIVGCA